jgi:hypothetical protein
MRFPLARWFWLPGWNYPIYLSDKGVIYVAAPTIPSDAGTLDAVKATARPAPIVGATYPVAVTRVLIGHTMRDLEYGALEQAMPVALGTVI